MSLTLLGISLDRSLVGGSGLGDAVWRHRRYAAALERVWYVVHTGRDHPAEARRIEANLMAYPTRSASPVLFPLDAYRLGARIAREHRVDVITAQDPFGTGLAGYALKRRLGIPLCVEVHATFFDDPAWLRSSAMARALHPLGKAIVRRADAVRVLSPMDRDVLVRAGVAPERTFVIPLMIDLQRFAGADGGRVRARYPGRRLVLFAGRFVPQKNLPLLVRAAGRLAARRPEALVVLAGDGPERRRLEALARRVAPGAVAFAGVPARDELPAYFAAAETVVLTSAYEGLPSVLVEAAAAGRPIVTTPLRNVECVVRHGVSGLVVAPTPEAVAGALADLLADPSAAQAMGEQGRRLVLDRFDPDRIFAALLTMWRAAAGARPGP